MPKIANTDVIEILKDPYFAQHAAMHLSRGRITLPDGTKLNLILPPCVCADCRSDGKMAESGKPEAGGGAAKTAATGAGKPSAMAKSGNPGAMAGMSAMADHGHGSMIEAGRTGSGRQLLEM